MFLKMFMCQNNLKYIQSIKSSFRLFYFHLGSFASIWVSIWVHLGKSTQQFPAVWRHAIDKSYRGKERENSDVSIREHKQLTVGTESLVGISLCVTGFLRNSVNRHREITSSDTNAKSESPINNYIVKVFITRDFFEQWRCFSSYQSWVHSFKIVTTFLTQSPA